MEEDPHADVSRVVDEEGSRDRPTVGQQATHKSAHSTESLRVDCESHHIHDRRDYCRNTKHIPAAQEDQTKAQRQKKGLNGDAEAEQDSTDDVLLA